MTAIPAVGLVLCLLTGQAAIGPSELLARGQAEYRAGRYADAAKDLRAAADAILTPDQMKAFVNTGQFDSLPQFETALIYLTLADVKLGREDDARQQLERLQVAEGIAPTYGSLVLGSDVREFAQVAVTLMPSLQLPANPTLAAAVPAPVAVPVPATVSATPQPIPAPEPAIVPQPQPALQAVSEAEQRYIDQKIAEARAEIERRAEQRIDAIQQAAAQEIANARAAAEREAQQKIAAAAKAPPAKIESTSTIVTALHRAAVQANRGNVDEAKATYQQLADAPRAQRDVIAAAAVGLYRTGDFAGALQALQKLGTLARGEEDLRYYKAVALFETGHYDEAKKELDCALPYIEVTDDVARYQIKIDRMQALSGSANSSS